MLCERFGWTPDEIARQDPIIMDSLFIIMQEQAKAYDEKDKGTTSSKRGAKGDTIRKKKYI